MRVIEKMVKMSDGKTLFNYSGLESDEKPTDSNIADGSVFLEQDTGKIFRFKDGAWVDTTEVVPAGPSKAQCYVDEWNNDGTPKHSKSIGVDTINNIWATSGTYATDASTLNFTQTGCSVYDFTGMSSVPTIADTCLATLTEGTEIWVKASIADEFKTTYSRLETYVVAK